MADFAPELHLDLINEVLIRLPAKSVGRFRCVSKPWRSHLSNPKFMKSHRNFHIHNSPRSIIVSVPPEDACFEYPYFLTSAADGASDIIVQVPPKKSSDQFPHLLTIPTNGVDGTSRKVTSPLFSRQKGWIRVGAECHGFVLVLQKGKMFVFNPVTLDALEVPRFPLPKNFGIRGCQFGMGYDSMSDDYKIVMLSYYNSSCGREYDGTYVDVYSLKMNSWRRVANSPFYHHDLPHPHPVAFTNGRLHWQAEDSRGCVIAAFNLAREEFERVPPPTNEFLQIGGELSVLGGCLAVECGVFQELINIWVMKEYGVQESWKNCVINKNDKNLAAACACPVREDEIVCKNRIDKDKFAAYNLSTGLWREFFVDGTPKDVQCVEWLMTFTESLLSPNHVADKEGKKNDFDAQGIC